jgi:Arm DNA-binding domain
VSHSIIPTISSESRPHTQDIVAEQKTYWDDTLQSLGCRISQGGTKSFVLQRGADRRLIPIGRYPIISLADARDEANTCGIHPRKAEVVPFSGTEWRLG